jgi:hypothetical protein
MRPNERFRLIMLMMMMMMMMFDTVRERKIQTNTKKVSMMMIVHALGVK